MKDNEKICNCLVFAERTLTGVQPLTSVLPHVFICAMSYMQLHPVRRAMQY